MNPDQSAALEVAKAIGPYVVAVIAIVGTFISAGLAQRNWQKQFGAQQSVVLLNKRLELAEALPSKLFEALQRGSALLLKARLSETLNILNSEGRQFSQDTINGLTQGQVEDAQAFQAAIGDCLRLLFLTKAFFSEQIAAEARECFSGMPSLNQSQEEAARFRNALKQAVAPGTPVEQVLVTMTNVANEHLLPISNAMSAKIGTLARLMVEYAKPNA